jgi:signal transduction histidine kinase
VARTKRQFSLAARLTVRLSLVFAAALVLGLGIFLLESFDEYRRDFGGRMAEAAEIIGRSIAPIGGGWRIDPSPAELQSFREIPDFRFSARRLTDGKILGGSDPVLASAFDVIDADSDRREERTAFRELVSSAAGPVEVAMTRSGVQAVDIIAWLKELSTEVLPALALIVGGSLLVVATSIRYDLRPLLRVARDVERIGPADTTSRLDETGVPKEILPLVLAVNGALRRLDAAFESQRQFTADAAHELKTPVAVLRARIDALSANGAATALRADVDRLSRLVDQLLTVSVLDGRAFDLDRQVDVGVMARGVVADLAPLAISRGRNLAFQGPKRPVRIIGNALALEELVRNLVENALRYTPSGEVVEVAVRDEGTIEVTDRGPGVPAHHREAIFRRFWRGAAANNEGAGLGLPIVKRIAEAHGGSVHVGDRKGGGAVFSIELPVHR